MAAVLGVLGFLFVQLAELREKLARQTVLLEALEQRMGDRFGALEKRIDERFDASEKRTDERFNAIDRRFDETRQDLAAIRALLEKNGSP